MSANAERLQDRGIKFGAAENMADLIARLPTRDDPMYGKDKRIEHLAHLGEQLKLLDYYFVPDLEQRFVLLSSQDVSLMGEGGVHRREAIFGEDWSFIPGNSDNLYWEPCFPIENQGHRRWEICPMLPEKNEAYDLYLVEISHKAPGNERVDSFNDPETDFVAVLLHKSELEELKMVLGKAR